MNRVLVASLIALGIGALVGEGSTIVRAASGWAAGVERVRRIRWTFLLTEVWVLALLGFAHATTPEAAHHVLAAAWLPVTLYVLAWMARDVGLWQIALRNDVRWTPVVALAAVGQLAFAGWAAVIVLGVDLPAKQPLSQTATEVMSFVAPVCVVAVLVLDLIWLTTTRRAASRTGAGGIPVQR